MRLLLLALLAAACSPDIARGSYFCGPERFCPPDMECDDPTYTCDSASQAQRFSCPAGTEVLEPDDSAEQALEAGELACGVSVATDHFGCVATGEDEDYIGFEVPTECVGEAPHLEVALRFPIAFVPLAVDLLDESGALIVEGELCTQSGNQTGTDRVCIDRPLAPGRYFLRIRALPGGPDCDGDCSYNEYTIDVSYPLA
jgi:hypothetical protein